MMSADKAREINSSMIWTEVCDELDYWIDAEVAKLRYCVPEELPRIQKVISTLENVKELPKIVIDREE